MDCDGLVSWWGKEGEGLQEGRGGTGAEELREPSLWETGVGDGLINYWGYCKAPLLGKLA